MITLPINSFNAFKALCTDDEILTEIDGSNVESLYYVNDNVYVSFLGNRLILTQEDFDRATKQEKGIIIKGYMFRFYKYIEIV